MEPTLNERLESKPRPAARLFRVGSLLTMLCTGVVVLAQVGQPKQLATGVFFREGDIKKGHCNNGWVVFGDYVLVIDANFPEAATEALNQAKGAAGNKPLRFVFDTTASEDHAFGNEVWGAQGATIVASDECLKTLTARGPTQFAALGTSRPDVKNSKLRLPQMVFDNKLALDDGNMRVELMTLGPAHNASDAVAYLPKNKVLFTGDVCVNGPFNFLGEANLENWIKALDTLLKLEVNVVAPGHGPTGDKKLLEGQRNFLIELRKQVQAGLAAKKKVEDLKNEVKITDPKLTTWVGPGLPLQVEAVYKELSAKPALASKKEPAKKPEEKKPPGKEPTKVPAKAKN